MVIRLRLCMTISTPSPSPTNVASSLLRSTQCFSSLFRVSSPHLAWLELCGPPVAKMAVMARGSNASAQTTMQSSCTSHQRLPISVVLPFRYLSTTGATGKRAARKRNRHGAQGAINSRASVKGRARGDTRCDNRLFLCGICHIVGTCADYSPHAGRYEIETLQCS